MGIIIPQQLSAATIFPLRDYEKIPKVKWREFTGALPTRTVTYGVDCGRSGLVVIDLDRNHLRADGTSADGVAAWRQMLADEGATVPHTFTVSTPSGGYHIYFTAHSTLKVKNSAGVYLGEGVDVRGEGGYVVGPDSRLMKEDGDILIYRLEHDEPIAALPDWLAQKLQKKPAAIPAATTSTPPAPTYSPDDGFPDNYARRALESAFMTVANAQQGTKNDTLNRQAFGAATAGAPVEAVINQLTRAAQSNGFKQEHIAQIPRMANEGAKHYVPRPKAENTSGATTANRAAAIGKTDPQFYTDAMLANRYAAARSDRFRYISDDSSFIAYSSQLGVWEALPDIVVLKNLKRWLEREHENARLDKTVGKDALRAAERCLSENTANRVLRFARAELEMRADRLDTHDDLLVVDNGVLDLPTGELLPHSSQLFITKRVGCAYDPSAEHWVWDKVLDSLPADARDWVQLMAGQSLTGHQPSTDISVFLHGGGANAKSSFLDLLSATCGTYGGRPPKSSLMRSSRGSDTYALVRYKGLRQAVVEELPDERHLDIGAIKDLVGTNEIEARDLHESYKSFKIQATLWISCNRLPAVSESDLGTWRRLLVLPFPYTYRNSKEECLDEFDRVGDPEVKIQARSNSAVFAACLAWRVDGAKRWYANRDLEKRVPASVTAASAEWQESNDSILSWANDCLVPDVDSYCLTEDLRDCFNSWLKARNSQPWGHKLFLERFRDHDRVFRTHRLELALARRPRNGTSHSGWANPADSYATPRAVAERCSHVRGIRFKTTGEE